jgi:hypothetical protein
LKRIAARHYASRPPRGSAAYEVASLKPDPADELLRWAEEPIAETGKPHPVLELREAVRQQRLGGDITSPLPVKRGPPPTVPVPAKGKPITGRGWTYVRDDRPFAGPDPPAAVYFYSRNRVERA